MKWGKVSKEELKMTLYEPDPDAGAVVLGDVGHISIEVATGDILYKLEHHRRVKIITQSGYDQGNVAIYYYALNDYETITGLKAQVILPNGDEVEVKGKDIFDEKINQYYSAKKFAFPGLVPGCVVEYRYTKSSKSYYNLEPWYFQGNIPVVLSQLTTEIPEWYHYVTFTQGKKAKIDEVTRNAQIMVPGAGTHMTETLKGSRITHEAHQMVSAKMVFTTYKLENIPALKAESYITTMQDYYVKIQFQLQMIQYPNSVPYNVENTWEKAEKELIEHISFGEQINKPRFSKKMWTVIEPILANAQNEEEKVQRIYNFVSASMAWDENYSFFADKTLDDAFELKKGNSGELNLMVIALCRQAGINAHPVLISTRSHGRMLPYYPKIDQFNHTLAYIQTGNKEFIFDIGSTFRSPELLRENSLNTLGWLVETGKSEWININAPQDQEVCMANFELLPDGTLVGSISQSFKGYCAAEKRVAYYNDRENKKIKEYWAGKFADIQIDSIVLQNEKELTEPLQTMVYGNIPEAVQVSGDFMYISPMFNPYNENPFKHETREFSIDMAYGFKNQYVLNLTIPDGYTVDDLPEAENLLLPNDGGKFQFFISQKGNTIQLINKISISQLHYEPEEYATVKNFFDIVVKKHSEQIVLKKVP